MGKNWVRNVHKEREALAMFKKIRNLDAYKAEMDRGYTQAVLGSMINIGCIGCMFLEERHGYKKKGMQKFLKYISDNMQEISDNTDEKYFHDLRDYLKEEYNLDVLEELHLEERNETE